MKEKDETIKGAWRDYYSRANRIRCAICDFSGYPVRRDGKSWCFYCGAELNG